MRFVFVVAMLLMLAGTVKANVIVDNGYELQNAIYNAYPGEIIYLSAGNYVPPENYFDVNRSVIIKPYGNGDVIINASGKTGGFKIRASDVTIDGLGILTISGGYTYGVELSEDVSNVTIKGLTIDCGGTTNYGIRDSATNISGLTISNVEIIDPQYYGIYLYDGLISYYTKDVVIDSVTITGAGGSGIYAYIPGTNSKNLSILNSKFTDCSNSGVYLSSVKGVVEITRTVITNNPTGIYVSGDSVVFTSNYIAGNDIGAKIYTSEFAMQGNAIKNNAHYGLYISGSGTAEIYNSEFDNNGNGAYTDGSAIYLTGGRSADIHNCNLYVSTNNYTIYNYQSTDVNAQNNYWGTTDTDLINESIYDSNDVLTYGTVFYDPILTQPAQIIPPPVPELATTLLIIAGIAVITLARRNVWK